MSTNPAAADMRQRSKSWIISEVITVVRWKCTRVSENTACFVNQSIIPVSKMAAGPISPMKSAEAINMEAEPILVRTLEQLG